MRKYVIPTNWIKYDPRLIAEHLANAKAAVLALKSTPYQKEWVENLQEMELKREIAGTSRIEGADFTERELEIALMETPEELITRSQKQARAAIRAYRWIATIPDDKKIDAELIFNIHRQIIKDADDDHCAPGKLREYEQNVTFGQPRHRGADGGKECDETFYSIVEAIQNEFPKHDPLIQALAVHYHLAAIHPFLDGNGRTARALEALFLQRAGLKEVCFISMSNYYYDEKISYLNSLSEVYQIQHDLTPFLIFGLKGISSQTRRLLFEIQHNVQKALFRNLMYDLFNRLKTPRKRVIAERQLEILKLLLKEESLEMNDMFNKILIHYKGLKNPETAFLRDIRDLLFLKAVEYVKDSDDKYIFNIRLSWPTEVTETEFFESIKNLPKAKTFPFL